MTPHQRAVELARLMLMTDGIPHEGYDAIDVFDDLLKYPSELVPATGVRQWTEEFLADAAMRSAEGRVCATERRTY